MQIKSIMRKTKTTNGTSKWSVLHTCTQNNENLFQPSNTKQF